MPKDDNFTDTGADIAYYASKREWQISIYFYAPAIKRYLEIHSIRIHNELEDTYKVYYYNRKSRYTEIGDVLCKGDIKVYREKSHT